MDQINIDLAFLEHLRKRYLVLNRELAGRVLKYTNHNFKDNESRYSVKQRFLCNRVRFSGLFRWKDTPEGHDFWSNLIGFKDGEYVEPVIFPKEQ